MLDPKEALDHCIGGGDSNPNLDREMHSLNFLTAQERMDLIDFLGLLTGTTPPDYGPPTKSAGSGNLSIRDFKHAVVRAVSSSPASQKTLLHRIKRIALVVGDGLGGIDANWDRDASLRLFRNNSGRTHSRGRLNVQQVRRSHSRLGLQPKSLLLGSHLFGIEAAEHCRFPQPWISSKKNAAFWSVFAPLQGRGQNVRRQQPVNRGDLQVVLTSCAKRPTAESPTMHRQASWPVYGPRSSRLGRVASAAQVGQGRSQSRPA
jgi:hypothetical protein